MKGKGVIHTTNATTKGVHTYLDKEENTEGRAAFITKDVGRRSSSNGGQPSGVQTGATKGRTEVLKQDGQHVGKAQAVDLNEGDEDSPKGADIGGQPPGAQTGAGKGRNWKPKGDKSQLSGTKKGEEIVDQPSGTHTEAGKDWTSGEIENDGQPMGTQTGVGKGRTLDKSLLDGAGTQTGVGKGRILDKEAMKKVETGEVTYDQPSGSQTEAGKGGNKVGTAKE
ncbi:hypothetical protein K7X08_037861 [Anisodus acutangulus]|uniref:Uncharacterized protein n=1 Tax=Anisodus acutangulus TaxID=402998 RepID=A0A9Q1MX90_9SOLA|nr:hypothetical protein K7X08_037861 [Anisodus acutangulus]